MNIRMPFAYSGVAGFCILLHNGVMIGADSMGASLATAILLSFAIVASAGYLLHGRFTFRRSLRLSAYLRYVVAMSVNIPSAFATTMFWHDFLGLTMAIAAPLASLSMLALNFILGRWAIAGPGERMVQSR